jgi:hypothetical protein
MLEREPPRIVSAERAGRPWFEAAALCHPVDAEDPFATAWRSVRAWLA